MESTFLAKRKIRLIAALFAFVFFFVSCDVATGERDISFEEIEGIVTETFQAMTEIVLEAAQTPEPANSPIPPTFTPIILTNTPLPPSPTNLPPATRINFKPGATYGTVAGDIQAGETKNFVLKALTGQPMLASVNSFNNDVVMSITTENGIELLPADKNLANWQGTLTTTQDYYFQVFGAQETETYTFWVSIPWRIEFDPGATSATVEGTTVDGYIAGYVLRAQGGQTMDVLLTPDSGQVALTIWGFSDGQPYIRSVTGSTTFHMELPSTQDYIIHVVPFASQEVDFTLRVDIK